MIGEGIVVGKGEDPGREDLVLEVPERDKGRRDLGLGKDRGRKGQVLGRGKGKDLRRRNKMEIKLLRANQESSRRVLQKRRRWRKMEKMATVKRPRMENILQVGRKMTKKTRMRLKKWK